jgi:hypothetical protein
MHEHTGHPIAVVIDEEDEEATKSSTAAKSSDATKSSAAIKSSVSVDEQKLAAKPYTTGVVAELTDKEKRATNKMIKEEVLQKMPQFKAVLGVPDAFGTEHWKELLSQMENVGDYLGWQCRQMCLSATPLKRQTFLSVTDMSEMSSRHVGDILLCRPIFLLLASCR